MGGPLGDGPSEFAGAERTQERREPQRMQISEVGVYTVKDSKIGREEFLPYTGQSRQDTVET